MPLLLLFAGARAVAPPAPGTAVVCLTLDPRALGLTLWARPAALTLAAQTHVLALTLPARPLALTLRERPDCRPGDAMTAVSREVTEGTQWQGESETLRYQITTTPWGSTPTAVTIVVKDMTLGGTDVSATVLSGVTGTSGDVLTLKALGGLTKNHLYRVEVQFTTADGNTWETFFNVAAQE